MFENTVWALLPPLIAIILALITKEAYSSLFIGVVAGGLMIANFGFAQTVDTVVVKGLSAAVADNAGVYVFLVILGILVAMINKAGGSKAFGAWASKHIKTKTGAAFATFVLGILIFVDDYFNCLTVGSVMRPLTDNKKMSRVKLAFLIDATAAPVCMIAPVSSWAAAVSGCVESGTMSGFELFVRAIPFNFYSLLTFGFIIMTLVMKMDYGSMAVFETKAEKGDIIGNTEDIRSDKEEDNPRGKVIDLVLPVVVLVVLCVIALVYVGGFFGVDAWGGTDCAGDFIGAFGNTDAFIGLPWGGIITLVLAVIYFVARKSMTFKEAMECIPKGFSAMIAPILILVLATALKNMTVALGAKYFVAGLMTNAASGLVKLLPAIIFLVACALSFSTGTSWGTFGILIPIVTAMFTETDPLLFIGISACLAGAVCGDHCSPISDTTIMASAGAQCNHIDHVKTQLPYALTVAAISFVAFIFSGFIQNVWICLPLAFVLEFAVLFSIRKITAGKNV